MPTEEYCEPSQRFLFAGEYFSDKAIAIWQTECINRCKEKEKGEAYENYVGWTRKKNELAIFTLYAYADFNIPKIFDIIFLLENPKEFSQVEYKLTQSIYEAWFPMNFVNQGHKHLCIFSFDRRIPDILNILHKADDKLSTPSKGQKKLGFCNSKDFVAISKRIEKTLELKKLYGEKWWDYDDGK